MNRYFYESEMNPEIYYSRNIIGGKKSIGIKSSSDLKKLPMSMGTNNFIAFSDYQSKQYPDIGMVTMKNSNNQRVAQKCRAPYSLKINKFSPCDISDSLISILSSGNNSEKLEKSTFHKKKANSIEPPDINQILKEISSW